MVRGHVRKKQKDDGQQPVFISLVHYDNREHECDAPTLEFCFSSSGEACSCCVSCSSEDMFVMMRDKHDECCVECRISNCVNNNEEDLVLLPRGC